jgi:energy-converting hydrogenase Eha subunit F
MKSPSCTIYLLLTSILVFCKTGTQIYASCAATPSGLVGWWPGDGSAIDVESTNNGTFTGAAYAVGAVGQAFSFDGSGNNVRIPASPLLNVGAGAGMTVEAWVYSTDNSVAGPIAEWVPKTVGAFGTHFYVHQGGAGALYANLYDVNGTDHTIQSSPGLVTLNVYHHVAVSYDKASGFARLFVDGTLVTESSLGSFSPQTTPDLSIGFRPNTVPFGPIPFKGRIDEVSVYSRALSTNEIATIYVAGSAGKCLSEPPSILVQPTNQTTISGNSVTLSVVARGTVPLSYQWMFNSTNLVGATNETFIISNVSTNDAGLYSVQITNGFGSVASSNVVLTVFANSCTTPPSGVVSWWPAEANAADVVGGNHGTPFNGTTFSTGEVGNAFTFNGTSSYVQIPNQPSLSFTNAFTIEFWYKDNGIPAGANAGIIAKRPFSGACNFGLTITGGSPASFLVYFLDPQYGSYQASTYAGLPAAGAWHHLAASYNQSAAEQIEIRTFVDGLRVKTATLSGSLGRTVNNYPVYFGCSNPPGGEFFKGDLDEVTIYNRALTDSEVASIFNVGALGKCFPPTAPFVFTQPTNQTVVAGSDVNVTVVAIGSSPLSYQWSLDGTNLPGATDALLTLTNIQIGQSGRYSVLITNLLGSIASSNALISVSAPAPCSAPPLGLAAWWRAEGNANDNLGANNGVFSGASYAAGEVGQAFKFDGSGNNVRVPASPSLNVGAAQGMTIEAWIYSTDSSGGDPIAEWVPQTVGAFGTHFWVHAAGPGVLYANLYDTANNSHIIQSAAGIVPLNTNQHVAVTYDKASGMARLFVEGTKVAESILGSFTPQTSPDLVIGYRPNTVPFGPIAYFGRIDEVSLYSRALVPEEIQAIYNAGAAGKCNVPVGPALFAQPTNQSVVVAQTATFQIQAGGTAPLSYQWGFGSTPIQGATNSLLALTNVQMSQAGAYSVTVTNAYGSVTSSNATLVVNFPPANVNVVTSSGTGGQLLTVPIVLVANGNENAVGFSLNFSSPKLTNVGVTLGHGATGASLQFNGGAPGTVGIAVAMPSGQTFAPGTQEVAQVSFIPAVSASGYSVPLTFGDLPTKRELSDAKANPLAANFNGAQAVIGRSSFEADLSPLPNGDGAVTVVDWVQVGRYVAALDSPTNTSEFQRADCAPRGTGGDGLLTVSDWVQAGRYAAGLDPLTLAAGPSAPAGGNTVGLLRKEGTSNLRMVTVQGPLLFPGQTATASIELQAQGDENAVGLSLAFDPKVVSYTGALLGSDATSATMDVNANQAASGQLGIILGLPTNASFTPGSRQLVKVSFQAVTTNSIDAAVTLADLPVRREVADTNALPVSASYVNGVISVNPKPSLTISQVKQTISLGWPLWATNYMLQQALETSLPNSTWTNLTASPVATSNAFGITLPVSGSVQFYRLQHQ